MQQSPLLINVLNDQELFFRKELIRAQQLILILEVYLTPV
jgi:hypothetical protein